MESKFPTERQYPAYIIKVVQDSIRLLRINQRNKAHEVAVTYRSMLHELTDYCAENLRVSEWIVLTANYRFTVPMLLQMAGFRRFDTRTGTFATSWRARLGEPRFNDLMKWMVQKGLEPASFPQTGRIIDSGKSFFWVELKVPGPPITDDDQDSPKILEDEAFIRNEPFFKEPRPSGIPIFEWDFENRRIYERWPVPMLFPGGLLSWWRGRDWRDPPRHRRERDWLDIDE